MRKKMKRIVGIIISICMILTSFTIPADAKGEKDNQNYIWVNNDKNIEYPAERTTASASSVQNGYDASRLLDGDDNTRWEATWNNAPESVDIELSTQSEEYIAGFQYTSRLDNNISGVMSNYKVYVSEDGKTYEEEAIKEGSIIKKLGTFFILFDEPVKAKSIKITSDVHAASEMRLLYIPSSSDDYDSLLEMAESLRKEAGEASGMDTGLWLPETLEDFDKGLAPIKDAGKPENTEELYQADRVLFELMRDLKRAQLESTVELNGQLRAAETLLESATEGTDPLMWKREDIDTFRQIITEVQNTAGSQVAGKGLVHDGKMLLEDGVLQFRLNQIKPVMTYTGTESQPLEHILDGLTESHFQGSGTGENVYFELDYKTLLQFESLTFQTWFATGQCIKEIKVQYKDEKNNWVWADDGKSYTMNWTTNTNESETQKVVFDTPVKGSAIRIYVMSASDYYVIDELTVGISIDEEDMEIYLDQEELEMNEGESVQLKATVLPENASNKNVLWSSSNESIVSVSQDGIVTAYAISDGEESAKATITAVTEYGNKSASCIVTVYPQKAEEQDKIDTRTRIKNGKKLADAAKEEDYKEGAISVFKQKLYEFEEQIQGDITVGQIQKIDSEIKKATKEFEESSLIPIRETKNLIERITGKNSSESFIIETIPADEETGMDVYEVDFDDSQNKVILRGNNGVSLATAYNYYLKYYAYLDFPYVGECHLELPNPLPKVEKSVRIVFPYEYRHYFNENCEYKYTTSLYGEEEWQHRIDWLAMNGFNMFLLDLGDHAIWYNAKDELGLNEEALNELRHSNRGTEQYFGKYGLSQEAVEKEGNLAKKVVEMAFKAGLEPEIRPFVGQVPFMFPNQREDYYGESSKEKMTIDLEGSIFDGMRLYSAARWMGLPQGVFISPFVDSEDTALADEMHEKFVQISDIYYESLMEVLGFNEYGRTPQFAYKDLIGEQGFVVSHEAFPRTVLKEMSDQLLKLNPDAIWMQTSWRYQTWLTEYYEEGHLMFVDLSADNRPKWNTNDEFGQTPWLWSMLFNFGGNTGLGGGMDHIAENVIDTKNSAKCMKGVSIAPEGGDTNPALYALMAEMTWRSEKPDVDQWLKDYAKRRYGADNYKKAQEEIDRAWDTLHHTVYSAFVSGDGPSQTLVNAYPKLSGAIARVYGSNEKVYETQDIIPVWEDMLKAAEKMENPTEQFLYDLTDITRQVLADISGEVYANIKPNFNSKNKEEALRYTDLMIQICEDLDEILATNKEFLVGTRLERAKNRGVTDSDQAYFEEVERTFLTFWVIDDPEKGTQGLMDYCNRHLSGLMTDYYEMRWKVFKKYLEEALDEGMDETEFNNVQQPKIKKEILDNAYEWAEDRTPYTIETKGDTIEVSKKIFEKYQDLIQELYGATDTSKDITVDGMTAIAGNQESDKGKEGPASNVLDGDTSTIWHTSFSGSEREAQYIIIDLNGEKWVDGLRYLPRQAGGVNGIITKYAIDLSNDGGQTYTQVAEGSWNESTLWKIVSFKAQKATHVKLRTIDALSTGGQQDMKFASAAEIRITAPDEISDSVDKTDLTALIAYAQEQQKDENYQYVIPVVKKAFEKALADAIKVNGDANATQETVDAAYNELLKMVHYLDFTGNSESLKVLVDVAKGLNEKLYTEESWAVFADALAKAEKVLANENALQGEIDAARDALQAAMDDLVKVSVDKTKLQKLVEDSKKYEDSIQEYTPATADIFKGALANARDILEKEDVTQEEIDAAYAQLQKAVFGLRLIPDKSKLEDLIQDAEKVDTSKYTEESANAFTAALNHAKEVFADENATEEDVKAAEEGLKVAKENLVAKADGNNSGSGNGNDNNQNQNQTDKGTNNGSGTVKTGDQTLWGVYLMITVLTVAAGVVAVFVVRRRKKEN